MNAIVSVCLDWGIGYQGNLLVRNRADMRRFVELTSGGTVVMGRATYESLPGKRRLKNRRNIILSRTLTKAPEGFECVSSLTALDQELEDANPHDVWCIGGEQTYRLLLGRCTRVFLTVNDCILPADAFFPNLTTMPEWTLESQENESSTEEGTRYCFQTWQKTIPTPALQRAGQDQPLPTARLR